MRVRVVRSEVPKAFEPLLAPARYKGAFGGRGAAKSHFFAERLLLRCLAKPTRAVCIREVQDSIRDSIRQLLVDKTQSLGIGYGFDILDSEIRGHNGSLVIFKGMQSYNAETIKSLEAYDVALVEEAQTLSAKSLGLLRPTIRKEGSELWFPWNPRNRTDPVDMFFRKTPHPDAVSVKVNWRDNPWFPEVLHKDMLHDLEADPEEAEHVWEGGYAASHGAIIARLVNAAERQGRINDDVEFDPEGPPIELSSDIGFYDTASWWFWQRRPGGFALLDYDEDSGLDASEWITRLQERLTQRQWPLGKVWLPHDAKVKTFQSRHSSVSQFLGAFGSQRVDLVPVTAKRDRINAARTVIKTCEFHKTRCEKGLDGLLAWEFVFNEDTQTFSKEPAHTWASHPSDGYSYGCQVMQDFQAPAPVEETVPKFFGSAQHYRNVLTLEDLWEDEAAEQQKRAKGWV